MKDDVLILVGGEGGEGVISASEILVKAAARAGYEVYTFRTFPAEIRGGHAQMQIRVSPKEILSLGDRFDVVIAMNDEAVQLHLHEIKAGGILIYDKSEYDKASVADLKTLDPNGYIQKNNITVVMVPMTDTAGRDLKTPKSKNMVATGAICAALPCFRIDIIKEMIKQQFIKKGDLVVQTNWQALDAGVKYIQPNLKLFDSLQIGEPKSKKSKRMVTTGNIAFSLGSILAGCKYFAGYPITPASDVLEYLSVHLPKFGGNVIQTEDEISALASVLGASYAGLRAYTATSGPGFSLMQELLGFAHIAELPCVVLDVQRGGPSTGLPTKAEQSDLNIAVFGAHGDAPRIVLAPLDVPDCLQVAIKSFNLADKYQTPVIVLSEQSLAHRFEPIEWIDPSTVAIDRGKIVEEVQLNGKPRYARYDLTEDHISPRVLPGTKNYYYIMGGLEHNIYGKPGYTPEIHKTMTEKRMKKLELAREEIEKDKYYFEEFGDTNASIGIMGWGATIGSTKEAILLLKKEGISVKTLYTKVLSPLPVETIGKWLKSLDMVVVIEMNALGQFTRVLEAAFKRDFVSLTKCDGVPIKPEEIVGKVKSALALERRLV
ncbi:MAG: 2-oxoacid:acceptor oxidoreductase subunit alpha [Planctomycetes bacterium]|nr:2-oxoacid:acceptor oxidoreductase subunit alpha [Planctomycetota bacterium]